VTALALGADAGLGFLQRRLERRAAA
jgi:hypothetical protein